VWNYRQLEAWKRSKSLAVAVYWITATWPPDERFGLVSQTRRAAVSVGANLAEGSGRGTHRAYAAFVGNAIGSLNELDPHVRLATEMGMGSSEVSDQIGSEIDEIGKVLFALRRSLLASP